MKRIVTSRTTRYVVLCLQCLFLLAGMPLSRTALAGPGRMELGSMRQGDMTSQNVPGMRCRSFAICCLAPPVPVRVSGAAGAPAPEKRAPAYLFDTSRSTIAVAPRATVFPTAALRVLNCCWRN